MARPDPALVTSIEDTAELVDNLSPQGKLFTFAAIASINTLSAASLGITLSAASGGAQNLLVHCN